MKFFNKIKYYFARYKFIIKNRLKKLGRLIKLHIREILLVVSFVLGWTFFTMGFAELWGNVVWKFSGGILFTGIAGYKFILKFLKDGFYILSEDDKK